MEVAAAVAVVSSIATAFYTKKSVDSQKKQIKAEQKAAKKQYDLDVAQTQLALEEEQRKNRNLLAQQQSSYKAKLGAGGMSSTSGSGQAVLNALQKEYDTEDKYLTNQANISLEALLNGINTKNTRNLLSLNQIKSQQASNTLSGINNIVSSAGRSVIK